MNLVTAWQQIVSASTLRVLGCEVLARWVADSGQLIGPALAPPEDWSLVDIEVIHQAAAHCARTAQCGLVFVNTSKELLADQNKFSEWLRKVQDLQATGAKCVVEISETIPDLALEHVWARIFDVCPRIALDDFGTQFSTISRLQSHSWAFCKIDARRLSERQTEVAIEYSRSRGITVIAECVEDTALRHQASKAGVDWHQGYLWSVPEVRTQHRDEVLAC